jgi:protein SCO1/2
MQPDRKRNLLVAGTGLALVALIGARTLVPEPPLPRVAALPAFSLTDQHGKSLSAADLRGKVWAADFIFTSCPDVCPLLTRQMVLLRKRTLSEGLALHYVSFSVDPETDTPEVLARFAKQHGAVFDDWSFLTGPIDQVKAVVVKGFSQAMERSGEGAKANVLHGTHFVLVDKTGTIRGFYESKDKGLVQLADDAERLEDEAP